MHITWIKFERKKIITYYQVYLLKTKDIQKIYTEHQFLSMALMEYTLNIYIKNILVIKCIDFSDEGGFSSSNTCTGMCKLIINN